MEVELEVMVDVELVVEVATVEVEVDLLVEERFDVEVVVVEAVVVELVFEVDIEVVGLKVVVKPFVVSVVVVAGDVVLTMRLYMQRRGRVDAAEMSPSQAIPPPKWPKPDISLSPPLGSVPPQGRTVALVSLPSGKSHCQSAEPSSRSRATR